MENSFPGTCDAVVDGFLQPLAQSSGGHMEAIVNSTHENPQHFTSPREDNCNMAEGHFANKLQRKSHSTPILEVSQNPQVCPTLMSISHILPPYINSSIYPNPLSSASCSSLESSVYQALPQVHSQRDQGAMVQEPRLRKGKMEHNLFSTETQTMPENFHIQNNFSLPEPKLFSTYSTTPHIIKTNGPSQHAFLPAQLPSYSNNKYGTVPSMPDFVSQTSRLLVEIATLKKENKELRKQLGDAKREIKLFEDSTKTTDDQNLDKVGALLEELHHAEKKRSLALSVLTGTADEEKTEACEKPKNLSKKYGSKSVQTESASDCEFSGAEDFYDGMINTSESSAADSGGISKRKPNRQRHMEVLMARQQEQMKEEMQKVLAERNEARQRVMKLEKKLATLELSCYTNNNNSNSLLAKLRVTERERDIAVAKLKYLARDVDETKLMYNLHKALLSDNPTNCTPSYNVPKISNLDFDLSKKNSTDSISKEAEEKAKLEARIALAAKHNQSQAEHIEKLEQLVKRQRQKISTLCDGPILLENMSRNI